MISNFRISRRVAASVVAVTLAAATAAAAMGLVHPEPVSSSALGPDWQCTRYAFMFTSCSRVVRFKTAGAEADKGAACPRPAWRNVLGLLL